MQGIRIKTKAGDTLITFVGCSIAAYAKYQEFYADKRLRYGGMEEFFTKYLRIEVSGKEPINASMDALANYGVKPHQILSVAAWLNTPTPAQCDRIKVLDGEEDWQNSDAIAISSTDGGIAKISREVSAIVFANEILGINGFAKAIAAMLQNFYTINGKRVSEDDMGQSHTDLLFLQAITINAGKYLVPDELEEI